MEVQGQDRVVLNPQPSFNGQYLNETKVFEGETLQQLLDRSEEARRVCGIAPGQDLGQYTYEKTAADGTNDVVGLQQPLTADGKYQIAPSNFERAVLPPRFRR